MRSVFGFLFAVAFTAPVVTWAGAGPGARVPWITYEAEDAVTSGHLLGPDYAGYSAAREASGRMCVRLAEEGQYLEFQARKQADGLVVRYSLPDSPDGRGIDATISLYINGVFLAKIPMTSRYSHLYGGYPYDNHPASGQPRNFWDEARLKPGVIHAGDIVRLQVDSGDEAGEYLIDFVDLEPVPGPLAPPPGAKSVTDFGATPDDETDDREAILAAIDAARANSVAAWFPPGRYVVGGPIQVHDVAVRGAGMWQSTLVGVDDYTPERRVAFVGTGSNVLLSDLAIIGKLSYRHDYQNNDGLVGAYGTGSVIRNVWVEHTKVGAWLVNADGLRVEGCRFRNTIADGINLSVGMRNSTVSQTTSRGTGDDGFAMWPATYIPSTGTPGSNRFVHCTAQLPFLAQGFSIYGGVDNAVEDCLAVDIPYGAGVFVSTTFPTENGFGGTTVFRRMRIVRAGDQDGAIGTVASQRKLNGLLFSEIDVIDSPRDGIKFTSYDGQTLGDARFDRIQILRAGIGGTGWGIVENDGAVGTATLSRVTVVDARSGGWRDVSRAFELILGRGNEGVTDAIVP